MNIGEQLAPSGVLVIPSIVDLQAQGMRVSHAVVPRSRIVDDKPAAEIQGGVIDRSILARIAVERTRMPMVITDPTLPDNPIVLANQAFLDQTGYSAAELIGHNCRFLQGDGTDPGALDQIRQAVADGREITIELLNYRKDGTPFWNQLMISPVRDDTGELRYFFASQQDVSPRRTAQKLEAEEHLLLREVDHRAKNALALVQGIVRLSRSDDPADYARSVQGRVDTLARAHSLLAEQNWRQVKLDRLIQAEVDPFGALRFDISGPTVDISASQVQPLGLLLHEMLSNAARHGALSQRGGRIAIDWTANGHVRIGWREVGGPSPAEERPPGFGSNMMAAIIRRQLNGHMTMDWSPEGLAGEIVFPHHASIPA